MSGSGNNGNNGNGRLSATHVYSALLITLGGAAAILPIREEVSTLHGEVQGVVARQIEYEKLVQWKADFLAEYNREAIRNSRNFEKLEQNDSDLSRAIFDVQLNLKAVPPQPEPAKIREMEHKP